jgi:Xaa-Pro aminopeptidase
VVGTTAAAVRDRGLAGARLALVGASFMTAAAYIGLREALPDAELVREDRLVELLRIHKSPGEIEVIRRACALGSRSMDAMMDAVVEGATEAEAVAEAMRVLYAGGGTMYDAACASGPNAHGYTHARLPSADPIRRLRAGDLFHVDYYGAYGGYYFDFARSRVVGDEPTEAQRALVDATIDSVLHVCAAVRPGMTAGELYDVGATWMAESDFVRSIPEEEPEMEGFPAFGHGIGLMWEGPWIMPGEPTPLEPGMYLGLEVLLGHPSIGGAMFEENGLVTEDGFEILTDARRRWW